jgi:outer membrane protein OmpA-like peptidoglycan-associated protein
MKKLVLFVLPIIIGFNLINLNAQSKEKDIPLNLGGYLGLNYNMHNGDFQYPTIFNATPNNVVPVGFYGAESSLGLNGGFIINVPFDNMFVFSGRLGLHGAGADFTTAGTEIFPGFITDTASYTDSFESSLMYGEVDLFMQFHNLIPVDNLYLLAGLEVGIPITASYERLETRVVTNDLGTTNTEFASTGDIIDTPVRLALALGAGYMMEISDNVFLTPEVSFRLPFSNVSDFNGGTNNDWNFAQLRAGVSLTFGFGDDEVEPDPESSINVGLKDIRAYNKDGMAYSVDNIRVEEVKYTELFPIVPYVFYNEGSKYPSASTQNLAAERETGKFVIEELEADAIEINKNTLDIIGTRMQQNTNADLKITGTVDNKAEKGKIALAKERAEQAKNYLVVNYGISPDRITVDGLASPTKPSSTRVEDGIAENRRVEFTTKDRTLLNPMLVEKEKSSIASPDLVEFVPEVTSTDSVTKWQLELSQSGKMIKTFNGGGNPNEIQWAIKPNQLSASDLPVEYNLSVENVKGKSNNITGSIPVEFISTSQRTQEVKPDKTISKFSLVVFDFDSPEISAQDKEIIDNNILPAIAYNSTVQIYGYSDRIGEENYNKKLALQRARNVEKYISSKAKDAKFEVYGIGESIQPFDNDLTIGRQLSRTVQIYVITPKEK